MPGSGQSVRVRHRPILPWVIWVVAAIAYALAIINRSSLSALGPAAQEHFHIDATTLATFGVIQLVVYAAMQIPVGTLLDRFGPTALILSGAVLMALGQIAMATVSEVWLAILARVLVGAGDACTFISVMRLLPEWFSISAAPDHQPIDGPDWADRPTSRRCTPRSAGAGLKLVDRVLERCRARSLHCDSRRARGA